MFTPQEIQEQTFSKAVFRGYDMQQVDDFLEPLTEDYITLYKENSVLKAKMKILVEKLEEYRAQETQQSLYDNKVQRLISSGMSEDEAKAEAAKAVAIPGTSEHQLGLAVDLVDANMQDLTSAQESTETQKWLMANSWRYGFIHRYPNGKTDITGIIYEPWHYRYVGKDAAQEIFNRDITLEEYLGKTEH